jgi:hypothetical protein
LKKKFDDWYEKEKDDTSWIDDLPDCPCDLKKVCSTYCIPSNGASGWGTYTIISGCDYYPPNPNEWEFVPTIVSEFTLPKFHPGGRFDMRTKKKNGMPGQQCIYDKDGKLITNGRGAGTPDARGPGGYGGNGHGAADVDPYNWALELDGSDPSNPDVNGGNYKKYMEVRRPNTGKTNTGEPCPKNP